MSLYRSIQIAIGDNHIEEDTSVYEILGTLSALFTECSKNPDHFTISCIEIQNGNEKVKKTN